MANQSKPPRDDAFSIREAGKFAVILGWIQVAVLPLVVFLPKLQNNNISSAEFVADAVVNIAYVAIIGGLLITRGRRLKHREITDLEGMSSDLNWLTGTTVTALVVSLLGGGRVGLLLILFIVAITRGRKALKNLRAQAAGATPAMASTQPIPPTQPEPPTTPPTFPPPPTGPLPPTPPGPTTPPTAPAPSDASTPPTS